MTTPTAQQQIQETAFALFQQNGIKSVSMDDICREMGISKKTLYKWFDNKDALVDAVINSFLKGTENLAKCTVDESKNAVHELILMMDVMRQVFAKLHPSVYYDLQKYHPRTWQAWQMHKHDQILHKVKVNLQRGIAEKLYRENLDIELISRVRLAQLDLAFNPAIFPSPPFSVARVQLALLEHFMLGIATLKGHKLINNYCKIKDEE